MLNLTILNLLQYKYLKSPFFTFSRTKEKKKINLNNLNIQKFRFSFIRIDHNEDISLKSSKFNKFLSSPIFISKTHILNDEIHERVSRKQSDKFHIYDTIFSNCLAYGFDSTGGALFVAGDKQQVLIDRSGFYNNSAMISGGSIFASCSQLSVKGSCFELSSAPKFFDIHAYCDSFNLSTTSITKSHSEDIEKGESSLGIDKSKTFSTQLNVSSVYSPCDACFIHAKNYFSLTFTFSLISNTTGFGLCLLLSPSDYTSFVYMTINTECDFLSQPLFFSASKLLLKDSVILKDVKICQQTDDVLALLHSCCLIGVEEKWQQINTNVETVSCVFIVNKYQADHIKYNIENILCWDQGKHLQSYLAQNNPPKNKLFGKKTPAFRLFIKTFILAASGTAFLIVLIISIFTKDNEKRPKAFKTQQKTHQNTSV